MDGYKKARRAEIKEISKALTCEYKSSASEAITEALLCTEEYKNAKTIMCYLSMDGEPSTKVMIEKMLADGKIVCIPLCTDKKQHLMVAKVYDNDSKLVEGAYGILEPAADAKEVAPMDIDLVVSPCVSCTKTCLRLGHGAGYYDRYLAKTDCPVIALCFEKLLSEDIPVDEYDVIMSAVITEEAVYRIV